MDERESKFLADERLLELLTSLNGQFAPTFEASRYQSLRTSARQLAEQAEFDILDIDNQVGAAHEFLPAATAPIRWCVFLSGLSNQRLR